MATLGAAKLRGTVVVMRRERFTRTLGRVVEWLVILLFVAAVLMFVYWYGAVAGQW